MASTTLASTVRTAFTEDGAVVMEIKKGLMYSSNPVAGRMLELLKAGKTHAEVSSTVAAECGVEVDVVDLDLKEFIMTLEEYGIAETSSNL